MDFMMHLLQGAGIIFWIAMMIDCLRSNTQHKGRWMIFMLITNWVGAVVYFFVVRPTILNPLFKFLQNTFWSAHPQQPPYAGPQPPAQAHMDPPVSAPYHDYQQGYQPQPSFYQPSSSASQSASQVTPEQSSYYPAYEQPQASYPEMPPMQQ